MQIIYREGRSDEEIIKAYELSKPNKYRDPLIIKGSFLVELEVEPAECWGEPHRIGQVVVTAETLLAEIK